jgi:hypothetical protein
MQREHKARPWSHRFPSARRTTRPRRRCFATRAALTRGARARARSQTALARIVPGAGAEDAGHELTFEDTGPLTAEQAQQRIAGLEAQVGSSALGAVLSCPVGSCGSQLSGRAARAARRGAGGTGG